MRCPSTPKTSHRSIYHNNIDSHQDSQWPVSASENKQKKCHNPLKARGENIWVFKFLSGALLLYRVGIRRLVCPVSVCVLWSIHNNDALQLLAPHAFALSSIAIKKIHGGNGIMNRTAEARRDTFFYFFVWFVTVSTRSVPTHIPQRLHSRQCRLITGSFLPSHWDSSFLSSTRPSLCHRSHSTRWCTHTDEDP